MAWVDHVRPRDIVMASRLSIGFTGTAALAQLGYALATPVSGGTTGAVLSYGIPLGLILLTVLLWRFSRRVPVTGWVLVPLLGLGAITLLDITSHDASVEGQVFLFFPILFAASQLPRVAAAALTALAMVAELLITYSSEPVRWATIDSSYICAGLLATALLLLHSTGTQDRLIERLAGLVNLDPLTGLATRRALDEIAVRALTPPPSERRHPGGQHGTALLVIDVDLFKTINDTYGHPAGDDFLVHVGTFLRERCRPVDVVARIGGDEFAVLLIDCPYQAALECARHLVEETGSAPFRTPDGQSVPVSISIGAGHVPARAQAELRELYAQADRALYRAKALGRGRAA